MLYVIALNAIYGIMKAALLFCQKFVGDLITIGFELNPYNPCVANKNINGKQLTLVWHVDDIKASNVETEVVTRIEKMAQENIRTSIQRRIRQDETLQRKNSRLLRHEPRLHHQR